MPAIVSLNFALLLTILTLGGIAAVIVRFRQSQPSEGGRPVWQDAPTVIASSSILLLATIAALHFYTARQVDLQPVRREYCAIPEEMRTARQAALAAVPQAEAAAESEAEQVVYGLDYSREIVEHRWEDVPVLAYLIEHGTALTYIGTDAGGLPAFLGSRGPESNAVYYVAPDGQTAVTGIAFDADGVPLTSGQLESAAGPAGASSVERDVAAASSSGAEPTTSVDKANELWSALEHAVWIDIGNPEGSPVYLIADPACPYCARSWDMLRNDIASGDLHVRVVPVSLIRGSNPAIVYSILSNADPVAAWDAAVEAKLNRTPLPKLKGEPAGAIVAALQRNHEMFSRWGMQQVPHFFYLSRDADGAVKFNEYVGVVDDNARRAILSASRSLDVDE